MLHPKSQRADLGSTARDRLVRGRESRTTAGGHRAESEQTGRRHNGGSLLEHSQNMIE
jgi:hypothetical protein